ncbi:hypothetical protein KPH14_005416 [Odynerus spinipes]|uniref:Uncharacterized protein n=1 Tax=Odynerus spinipes TaxID=1348599 RepID=A0AAD9RBP0_9HYME|nr:hypothetical protein KPH14_005416 [Odynerus spinipes]
MHRHGSLDHGSLTSSRRQSREGCHRRVKLTTSPANIIPVLDKLGGKASADPSRRLQRQTSLSVLDVSRIENRERRSSPSNIFIFTTVYILSEWSSSSDSLS